MSKSKTYNKKHFLKANSLIESVIAITIIATCLLIAIRVYVLVLNSSDPFIAYKIRFKVDELVASTKREQTFDNEIYNFENYTIEKKVEAYQDTKGLKKVKYIATTTSDTIVFNYLLQKKENE